MILALRRAFGRGKAALSYARLNTKLLIMLALILLLPTIVSSYLYYAQFAQSTRERAIYSARKSFDQAYTFLDDKFYYIHKNVLSFLSNELLRSYVEASYDSADIFAQKKIQDQLAYQIHFLEDTQNIARIHVYALGPHEGDRSQGRNYGRLSDISGSRWYAEFSSRPYRTSWVSSAGLEGDETPQAVGDADRSDLLSLVGKLVDEDNYRRTIGMIRVDFSKSEIEKLLRESFAIRGSSCRIVADGGVIVASAGTAFPALSEEDIPSLPASGWDSAWIDRRVDGHDYLVGARWFENSPWRLLEAIPEEGLASQFAAGSFVIAMATAIGLLSCLFVFVFSRTIIARLSTIASSMRGITQGRLTPLPTPSIHDEIGSLVDDYNFMVEEIAALMRKERLTGRELRAAELRTLQEQINPHFLYNTLELINWYASTNDPARVERIVGSLSRFYKLSLNHGEEVYQVWQELDLVSTYFEIQNLRYEGRMSISIEVPETMLHFSILKITIQPIVENAIQHGILRKKDKDGTILISGKIEGEDLVLVVADDGAGIEPERLERLRFGNAPIPGTDKGSGYGLRNVAERIKMYYGVEYGISVESSPESGTSVTIRVPAR
jgi:Predicted signal transduction protein with a C-terminal ATPase domain